MGFALPRLLAQIGGKPLEQLLGVAGYSFELGLQTGEIAFLKV